MLMAFSYLPGFVTLAFRVAYLSAADNVSEPFPIRLPLMNQSVISTPNVFSTLRPSLLADI